MNKDQWETRVTLLEKIKNRYDESAWEDFVFYYQKFIFMILRKMNLSISEAEELSQKIIIKLWDKLPEFNFNQGSGKFRSWLCTVVRNQARNYIRDQQNSSKHKSELDESPNQFHDMPCTSEIEKIAEKEWAIYVAKLAWKNILKNSPGTYLDVFSLHANGNTVNQIAESTKLPVNTIHVYLKRSRDKLKSEIKRLSSELL
ncbi:probable ECF sigma factor [Lentisphaera araneosa HTCC2155]|uniref:Probable ECF sigma factor n=1 Tax=Lentisphaera araneosa HTCC2155 TaxID=313628 RepID=A6DQB6_9BACT|nr:sigma-70 family RNA polymerase sigma factor [Lentisphaera araneosa]EDM26167.1 probable ECF sigma factor [Lentisphaera araneosa HTCC2155]